MLLDGVNSPKDLRALNIEQLPLLAGEIRQRIIGTVSQTGGHLASSLGAVELIMALHYCLDTPRDKIVFDVGHQAYAHKILTARNAGFNTLRQYRGISGFPSREESVYDTFTTGHSSTAVSLALGLACARDYLKPEDYFRVAAVIGDGSLSGGLCFEGLNNAGHLKKDIIVVLNTNDLSIAPNVGALSNYLNKIISQPLYNRFKNSLEAFVKSRLPKESRIIRMANKFEEGLKGLFIPGMLFEELGFRYFGPLDGHNLGLLIRALKNILVIKGPVLLHVVTKKGKGYAPAENEPVGFHGTAPFDIASGAPKAKEPKPTTYTEVFSRKITEIAQGNKRLVAITAAMPEGTGLDKFRLLYPQRFFDVGIAEEHAISFAAGLSREGMQPVVSVYSTFLQRAYDQLIECVALQNLGVIFAVDRAGIVGEDGATHQGIFDLVFLRSIPNFVIMAPKDGRELEAMLEFAVQSDQPIAIRYPRDRIPPPTPYDLPLSGISLGEPEVLREGKEAVIFALGSMVYPSLRAAEILDSKGIKCAVVNSRFVKPLDVDLLNRLAKKAKFIFSVEEGILDGGFGSALSETLGAQVHRIGLPCAFVPHGARSILLEKYGLTSEGIAARIKETVGR